MIGMPFVGAIVAHVGFWVLLTLGLVYGDYGKGRAVVFVGLWILGFTVVPRLAWWTAPLVTPWVAILDIILVFVVFKGDVRLG